MAKKLILRGKLKNRTAFHTGAVGDDFYTDQPLARNGSGNFYIPGTSLAGALRAYAQNLYKDEKIITQLFGYQNGDDGWASRVFVEDAEIHSVSARSIRDHLVIMRETGTAAPSLKFDEEIIEAGSTFDFLLEIDLDEEIDLNQIKGMVKAWITGFKNSEIILGASGSRGMGRFTLTEEKVYIWDLSKAEEFDSYLEFLVNDRAKAVDYSGFPDVKSNKTFLNFRLLCGIDGPFMIKDGVVDESAYDGDAPDMVCRKEMDQDGKESFVIPGSSIKGAFRAQTERIINLCRNKKAFDPLWYKKYMSDGAIDLKKFGQYLEDRIKEGAEPKEVSLCFGSTDDGQGAFLFEDAYFKDTNNMTKVTNHVAIDPLTGGAKDGALYSMEAIWNQDAEFELAIQVQNPELWQLGLLGHLLKDLFTGEIRLGFGKMRGMGKVTLKKLMGGRVQLEALTGSAGAVDLPDTFTGDAVRWLDQLSVSFNEQMKKGA
ncbi:MAG: RAMP superfamily CRISPR-associated protein [Calditrichaceae bacterium]